MIDETKQEFPLNPRECPRCHGTDSKVYDSRTKTNGVVLRRHMCKCCYERWYSEEITKGIVGEK